MNGGQKAAEQTLSINNCAFCYWVALHAVFNKVSAPSCGEIFHCNTIHAPPTSSVGHLLWHLSVSLHGRSLVKTSGGFVFFNFDPAGISAGIGLTDTSRFPLVNPHTPTSRFPKSKLKVIFIFHLGSRLGRCSSPVLHTASVKSVSQPCRCSVRYLRRPPWLSSSYRRISTTTSSPRRWTSEWEVSWTR